MAELTPTQWIAECADRLLVRWRTLDRAQLEEAAMALWGDARWRGMAPAQAAGEWLRPVESWADRDRPVPGMKALGHDGP
ncbi:MAG TPA: hypothetical protein VN156_11770 [Pseudomonas sp.]|nr:hypothetical protein [Pseudomonas sp.]